jgi:hypothetical protein
MKPPGPGAIAVGQAARDPQLRAFRGASRRGARHCPRSAPNWSGKADVGADAGEQFSPKTQAFVAVATGASVPLRVDEIDCRPVEPDRGQTPAAVRAEPRAGVRLAPVERQAAGVPEEVADQDDPPRRWRAAGRASEEGERFEDRRAWGAARRLKVGDNRRQRLPEARFVALLQPAGCWQPEGRRPRRRRGGTCRIAASRSPPSPRAADGQ